MYGHNDTKAQGHYLETAHILGELADKWTSEIWEKPMVVNFIL